MQQQASQTDGAHERSPAQGEALVIATMQRHADALLRIARRHSLCDDDAADAYQRSLEIFLLHVRRLDEATAHRWLFRVVRHEAMAVREQRQRSMGTSALEPDLLEARTVESPEDRVVRMETMAHAAEALNALKEAELQALWLQASGNSYAQIAELRGWTRTKVNRALVEGRRRFLAQRDAIDSGQECERWRPVLSALVDGRASARQLTDVRPHLRNCQSCQAHVRQLHRVGAQAAGVLPVGLVAGPLVQSGAGRVTGWLTRLHDAVGLQLQGLTTQAVKVQVATDALSAGKLAAVAASAAAMAGGGVAVVGPGPPDRGRPAAASRASAVGKRGAPRRAVVPVSPVAASVAARRVSVARQPAATARTPVARAQRPTEFVSRAAGSAPAELAAARSTTGPGPERISAVRTSGGGSEFAGGLPAAGAGTADAASSSATAAGPTAAGAEFGP
ncbi:MAG: polymerase, sigma-24 subunit, subfamily [Solirubrobacterales bacterium]|nr:polymerase, sigma-24 subunit, subfamily [Solirubrobacterales bacterium]